MKPVRLISPTFELLGEIADYESLIFEHKWFNYGEFEMRINRHKKHTEHLVEDGLIILGNDTDKVGIIRHKEIEVDENGKVTEVWIVKGNTLGSILNRRITVPPDLSYDKANAPIETILKQYVNNNCIAQGDRTIPNLIIAPDQARGPIIRDQTRYKTLSGECKRLATFSGLGWRVSVDYTNENFVFDVYEGTDRTVDQTTLPPIVFSTKFGNVETAQYLISSFNYASLAYVAGQGEKELRRIVTTGSGTGLRRFEAFVDARDIDEEVDEVARPEQDVIDDLISRGQQELAERGGEQYFEASIKSSPGFTYETDWFLGDFVTVQVEEWGITANFQVTAVIEIYEKDNPDKIELTFGLEQPSLDQKLSREFGQFSAEVRK